MNKKLLKKTNLAEKSSIGIVVTASEFNLNKKGIIKKIKFIKSFHKASRFENEIKQLQKRLIDLNPTEKQFVAAFTDLPLYSEVLYHLFIKKL